MFARISRRSNLLKPNRSFVGVQARAISYNQRQSNNNQNNNGYNYQSKNTVFVGAAAAVGVALLAGNALREQEENQLAMAETKPLNVEALRQDIIAILDNADYDDGSFGPILVRLAWHACGTYNKNDGTGGSNGATMRFKPESEHGANAGLDTARALLGVIHARYPQVSISDLWQFAAVVAIEEMGGPTIPFTFGRVDKEPAACTPDGRLPDAAQSYGHLRDIFYRMGFNDQEIVALSGAHALGRCHTSRSGFDGPWTKAPTMFSNEYYRELLENTWTERKWSGPTQFQDPEDTLMMLPTDVALIQDPEFRKYVEKYANDEQLFFADFASAFQKLQELGCTHTKSWWQFW